MSKQIQFNEIKKDYTRLLKTVKIKKSWLNGFKNVAAKARANQARYEEISAKLGGGVPWEFIAAIHNLESGMNFNKHLHNGDSLRKRTRRVPAGRPRTGKPPFTWEESAVDALKMKGLHKVEDWSWERMCYELERYNGFGYRLYHSHVLSPYLWSGTNHYVRGKYVRDGKFSNTAISRQAGAIGILKVLMADKELSKKSTKQKTNSILQQLILTVTGGTVLSWQTLNEVRVFMQDNAGIITLAIGAVAFVTLKYFELKAKQDVKEGRYIPSGMVEDDE